MINAPAFQAVSARRALHTDSPHQQPTPPPQPTPAPRKMAWPQPVRDYVQRAFDPSDEVPGISKAEIEAKLREIITNAANSQDINSIDWTSMPTPQQIIYEERYLRRAAPATIQLVQPVQPFQPQLVQPFQPTQPATPPRSNEGQAPRKRKSTDGQIEDRDNASIPPWRKVNGSNDLDDRITYSHQPPNDRMSKRQKKKHEELSKGTSKYQANLERRRNRFRDQLESPSPQHQRSSSSTPDATSGPIVGTSLELEKPYLRLTAPPKPSTVRPLHTLEKTLELLKRKWKEEENYTYICDQFKSLRQDLTVQHIRNEFTVDVYETHARIALERGDLGEYNQCQTQLRALYSENLGGHPSEFLAYRILYLIHTCNRADMNDVLADLNATDKAHPAVKHALEVRSALALGNYHRFFLLYLEPPNMGGYLMDSFIVRERLAALANITKAYKMDVKLRFLTEELGFNSDSETEKFLSDNGAGPFIQIKGADQMFATAKAGQIFEQAKLAAFRKVDIKGQI